VSFDFLLGLPSEPGARGLLRGRPDPDFLAEAAFDATASLPSCCSPLNFVVEAGVETGGVGGEVRTLDKNSRISSMMHLQNISRTRSTFSVENLKGFLRQLNNQDMIFTKVQIRSFSLKKYLEYTVGI
jgi:hypothetical protein